MHYTIYKTTNIIDGKIYIGKHQTKNLSDGYLGSGKHLNRAIKKHGIENFRKEILFVFDNESDMNAKEAELVTEEFSSRSDTYNLCPGGQGGFGYINQLRKNDLDMKTRVALALKNAGTKRKGRIQTEERRRVSMGALDKARLKTHQLRKEDAGYRQAVREICHSANLLSQTEESKAKRIETMRTKGHSQGSKNSQFGTMWITDGAKNKKIEKNEDIPEGWNRGRSVIVNQN